MPRILTKEERHDLLNHHIAALIAQAGLVETARAPFDAAKSDFTELVNKAKGDLGKRYTRNRLVGLMAARKAKLRDLVLEEEERADDHMALNLPLYGQQQEMFSTGGAETPQEAKDELQWKAEGYLAGLRGDSADLPEGMPPRMAQHWLAGRDKGQAEIIMRLDKGAKIAASLGEPDVEQKTVDLNGAAASVMGDDGKPDPAKVAAEAERLAKEGWTGPGTAKDAAKAAETAGGLIKPPPAKPPKASAKPAAKSAPQPSAGAPAPVH